MSDEKQESSLSESESLRGRIAEVIGNTSCIATDLEVADAVIAELGLREEWGALDGDYNGVLGDTREEVTGHQLHPSERVMHRLVTNWKAEDE